ncbi:hypothetical protein GE061_012084 [Apolygus lucorum]|uniref:TTF-type domain-containing protein n=1 Tax=Apolygus lucorum TaxID=248454 RepID=A0A8S9XTD7_APOLU|nr:hypothetical protein GE061_012084 [Apolygus lucorum]
MKRALDANDDGTVSPEKLHSPKRQATLQPSAIANINISDFPNPLMLTVLGNDVTENCNSKEEITGSVVDTEQCGEPDFVENVPHKVDVISEEFGGDLLVVPESTADLPPAEDVVSENETPQKTYAPLKTKYHPTWQSAYVFQKSKEIKKTIIVHKPVKNNVGELGNPVVPSKTSVEPYCCIMQTFMKKQLSWTQSEKIVLIENGPPQPIFDSKGFALKDYENFPWLAGCIVENKVFCWCCLLFSSIGIWTTSVNQNQRGAFLYAMNRHASTTSHAEAHVLMKQWSSKTKVIRNTVETESSVTIPQTPKDSTCLITRLIANGFIQGNWTEKEREEIIAQGRPTPKWVSSLTALASSNKNIMESFCDQEYKRKPWLCGSAEQGKLFCWPCVLFCPQGAWSNFGYVNLSMLTQGILRHEISQPHLESSLRLKVWEQQVKKKSAVQKLPRLRHNEVMRRSRDFMKYVVDVVCYFKKKSKTNDATYDDYMKVIKTISRLDSKLQHYLRTRTFLEDEISSISKSVEVCLKNRIIKEVNSANFVVLMLNQVGNKPWLSVVLRYVKQNGDIMERFLQFIEFNSDRTINNILHKVLDAISFINEETKLIGFTHDESLFKPLDLAFFSSKMTEKHPTSTFFHYGGHNLKSLLQNSLSQMDLCKTFIYGIQELVKFFEENSIAKTSLIIIDQEISGGEKSDSIWDFSSGLIETLNYHYSAIIKLFERMVRSAVAWNTETIAQAQNFISFLQPLESRFLIATISRALGIIDELTKLMETDFNVDKWRRIAEKTTEDIIKTRCEDFEDIFQSALSMVQSDQEYIYDIAYAEKFDQIMEAISIFIHGRTKDLDKWSYMELAMISTKHDLSKSSLFKTYVECLITDFPNMGFEKLSAQLTFLNGNAIFKGKTFDELIKYIHELDMVNALPSLHKFSQLLLTTTLYPISSPKTPTIKRLAAYFNDRQKITSADTLMYVEKDLLTELQTEPDFYRQVITHFVNNLTGEH